MLIRPCSISLCLALLSALPAAADQDASRPDTSLLAEVVCAPRPPRPLAGSARILGGLEADTRYTLGTGDRAVVSGGAARALRVGDTYWVRRLVRPLFAGEERSAVLATAGWVEIESVQGSTAVARVVWACDGVEEGDQLEPFAAPTAPPIDAGGSPAYDSPGVVLAGLDSRTTGGTGDRLLIDPLGAGPLSAGQRVTFFRRLYATRGEPGPITAVGEGHVMEVGAGGAVVRIDAAVTAVRAGDHVAPHR